LVRLRCGIFDIKDTVSLPQLEDAFQYGYWQRFIYPIDIVLSHLEAVVVSDSTSQSIRKGRPLDYLEQPLPLSASNYCRVYTQDGCFLGVLRFDPERRQWQPEKVFL